MRTKNNKRSIRNKKERNTTILILFFILLFIIVSVGIIYINEIELPKVISEKETEEDVSIIEELETDKEGMNIYLPKGATIISDDPEKGIVIKDKNDNLWTWVEVNKKIYEDEEINEGGNIKPINSDDVENIEKCLNNYTEEYLVFSTKDEYIKDETEKINSGFENEEDYYKKLHESLKNIYLNGGFYIARYEVGTDEDGKACIQKNKKVLTNKNLYEAEKISEEFGENCSLPYGVHIKLTFKFIEQEKAKEEILYDSSTWGIYRNMAKDSKMIRTGTEPRTAARNIFDLAGNCWEFTLESFSGESSGVARGGSYYEPGFVMPAASLWNIENNFKSQTIGFRPIMY